MQQLKVRSIKLNFILNNTRLLLNFLTPVIVFPYISRILGPVQLGKVEYANSIVSYFVLFAALGIPVYGIREIARVRDNPVKRSKTVFELTLILAVTTLLCFIAYFLVVYNVSGLYESKSLFFVIAPAIFLSGFSYEWFYIGIEDQAYITIRFIFIKIIQVILIFMLIKESDDFIVYAGILVGLNGASALFNIVMLKKYIHHIPLKQLNIKRHIRTVIIIFGSIVAINIYQHLDVTMVGAMVGDRAVGLYTAANKVVRIIGVLVTSLATVIIPRIENALKKGDMEGYKKYLDLSLRYILLLGVPCFFGLELLAPEIIKAFAGVQYSESILSIRLLSPVVLIVGMANFVGWQILYPNRKEKYYTIAVSVAAAANAVSNALMIPFLEQNGAIIGTLLAEGIGLVIQIGFAYKLLIEAEVIKFDLMKYIFAGLIMGICLYVMHRCIKGIYLYMPLMVVGGVIIYGLVLIILKDNILTTLIKKNNVITKSIILLNKK